PRRRRRAESPVRRRGGGAAAAARGEQARRHQGLPRAVRRRAEGGEGRRRPPGGEPAAGERTEEDERRRPGRLRGAPGRHGGGRVQVFDSLGTFVTQWMAEPRTPLVDMEVDRGGTVYVVQGGRIKRYEGATGRLLGTVGGAGESVSDLFLALDGTLWAAGFSA